MPSRCVRVSPRGTLGPRGACSACTDSRSRSARVGSGFDCPRPRRFARGSGSAGGRARWPASRRRPRERTPSAVARGHPSRATRGERRVRALGPLARTCRPFRTKRGFGPTATGDCRRSALSSRVVRLSAAVADFVRFLLVPVFAFARARDPRRLRGGAVVVSDGSAGTQASMVAQPPPRFGWAGSSGRSRGGRGVPPYKFYCAIQNWPATSRSETEPRLRRRRYALFMRLSRVRPHFEHSVTRYGSRENSVFSDLVLSV